MKVFVVLSAVVACALASHGYGGYGQLQQIPDTHEVAAAKAAHFAAVEAAKVRNGGADGGYGHGGAAYGAQAYQAAPAYGYAPAAYGGHEGPAVDTPEIVAAKAQHFAAHAEAAARNGYGGGHVAAAPASYGGQYGHGAVLAPGQDTHEVAAAKAAHFAAVEAARQQSGAGAGHYDGQYAGHYSHAAPLAPGQAIPDTPEVAAARAQHLAAHSAALHGGHGHHY